MRVDSGKEVGYFRARNRCSSMRYFTEYSLNPLFRYKLPSLVSPDDDSKDGGGEALVDLLSQFIFVSSAFHELVGVVVDYVQKP